MLFNSYAFLFLFLPVALAGYALLSRLGPIAARLWLVILSFAFYGVWDFRFLPVLAVSALFNFAAGRAIEDHPRHASWLLGGAVAIDLLALAYCKYLAAIWAFLFAQGAIDAPAPGIVLPLGISFFTFTQIGYLIDRRANEGTRCSLLSYLLFVTFFPHLIAGPILHHRELMPQLTRCHGWRLRADNLAIGSAIFAIGLVKKCLLADSIGAAVPDGFAAAGDAGLFAAWHTALAYSLQLYFDFSGYSDMAIGLARMFNIRFPANFDSPYKAASVIDYWQRWHMTLTRYLMLYLYNPIALALTRRRIAQRLPVGPKEQSTPRGFLVLVACPIFVTMTLAGIWHGAGLTFLVFGLLHAVYLAINHAWRLRIGPGRLPHAASVALTYLSVLVGAVLFRAADLTQAGQLLAGMIGLHGIEASLPTEAGAALRLARTLAGIALLYGIVWFAPNTQQIMRRYGPVLGRVRVGTPARLQWRLGLRGGVLAGACAALGLLALGGAAQEFLYFQF